jgi:hypothetical protein
MTVGKYIINIRTRFNDTHVYHVGFGPEEGQTRTKALHKAFRLIEKFGRGTKYSIHRDGELVSSGKTAF